MALGDDRSAVLGDAQDAFGQQLIDALDGNAGDAVIERDDGSVSPSMAASKLLLGYDHWTAAERRVFDQISGRVLDVGCGAGRHALEAQRRGLEVVAIDISPGAASVSRRRGVDDVRLMPLEEVDARLGMFDSVLMLCGNFGLAGSADGTVQALRRLFAITTPNARIVLDTVDPYADDDDPSWPAYLERNRARGVMPGQVTIRIRYGQRVTPWFDLLLVSSGELADIAGRAGWRIDTLDADGADIYAVLAKL